MADAIEKFWDEDACNGILDLSCPNCGMSLGKLLKIEAAQVRHGRCGACLQTYAFHYPHGFDRSADRPMTKD